MRTDRRARVDTGREQKGVVSSNVHNPAPNPSGVTAAQTAKGKVGRTM